ncbi:MAG: M20/M25/M40 family metallo-hydrolase [Bacteroidales bacterium]|nr:M20/M25/M40 family metallo-hydrolase [Bacteroidales bacterium]MCL2133884.1 M20/M25/M40 family metallo-hydrolase [Bacteroidales bacterium]
MKKLSLLCIIILFQTLPAFAQEQSVVNAVITIAKTDNQTMQHLDVLTNRIGGRPIGSYAYETAIYWAANLFKKWELEVEIQEVGALPVGFNRGPWFGKMLDSDGMILHFATPSYTSGTKGVQRGHVVAEPKTTAQFNRMKGKLKGAWVLITGVSDGYPIDYSAKGDSIRQTVIAKNDITQGYNDSISRINRQNPNKPPLPLKELDDAPALFYKEMREVGILGIIQSAPVPITALYDRKNVMDMDFDRLPSCPDIKLDEKQYAVIAQKVKERQYFLLEFDIRNHFRPGPVKYHNVIGIIRGSEFPDEYVMTGGHLDSYDTATGAVDCGTGVAPNLEAARMLMMAGAKPRRTILFCLWAGEEFGLLGSKYWVENNTEKLPYISNYFNRDGGPTVANSLTVPAAMYDDFQKATAQLNDINPDFPFTLQQRRGNPPVRPIITTTSGGSDHYYFAANGVPAISFGTADPKGYDFNYYEIWHTERDTYNMSIPEYMEHTSAVIAITVYNLANFDKILSREGLYR